MLDFLDRLDAACWPGRRVLIDLASVATLSPCAALVVASRIIDPETSSFLRQAELYVRQPKDPTCNRLWQQLTGVKAVSDDVQPLYQDRVLSRRKTDNKVQVKLAELLIHEAMRYLTNGSTLDHHGSYRVLTESMANTFKHADPKNPSGENWCVASYAHPTAYPRRWCFAFVDNGVGIL